MFRRAAPMLLPLLAQVTLFGVGMRQVTGRRVMHDGLTDLADGGDHSLDEEEDEEEAQEAGILALDPPGINVRPEGGWFPGTPGPYRPEHDGVPAGTPVSTSPAASPCDSFDRPLARSLLNERLPHVAAWERRHDP